MRIATFNANSIRARLEIILAWLDRQQPDVLCIQETKVQDHDFPVEAFTQAGYHVVFKGEKSYNGVALISKRPVDEVRFGLDGADTRDETRLLYARLGPLHIVNTYVPQGRELDHPMFRYKLEWFRRLRAFFDHQFTAGDLLVWTGDMNVAAEPQDVHSPELYEDHVCYHTAVRQAFAQCRAWGFVDIFRRFHPEPEQFTFFDYRTANAVKRGIGWRFDYLLLSPALAGKAVNARIDLEPRLAPKASDHTFVLADCDVG